MTASNSRSLGSKCLVYFVALVALASSRIACSESGIRQIVEVVGEEGGERRWKGVRCDLSQPRFDVKCYAKLMNESLGCESDLGGVGSLDTICRVRASVALGASSIIVGTGTLELAHHVSVSCESPGCEIVILLAGGLTLGRDSAIRGGTLTVQAANVTIDERSAINSTAQAGVPPPGTSGTPSNFEGAGGGHGGRGASCERNEGKDQGDVWGGDMYEWERLATPWSHGSRGGSTDEAHPDLGGAGGGRIALTAGALRLDGAIAADGGSVGDKGGGGSGGSIVVKAQHIEGKGGTISASGGTGRGGGGGGRVSIDYEYLEGVDIFYHGGDSWGCPQNAGAAGTRFDVKSQSLIVSNNNKKSKTDTVLLAFSVPPLWGNVVIKEFARIGIPLQWSTIRVTGQVKLMSESVLSFGLAESSSSELELMANDFVMENSTFLVYGALRLSAKMLSMTSSRIDILASQDKLMVVTSTVEGSNLAYVKGSSVIRSNANLAIYGQGLLELEGPGDTIMAQRLFVSLFFNVIVGSGAILRAPVEADSPIQDQITSMYCGRHQCPTEVLRPSEDCTLNITSPFTLQICRVEDVDIYGEVSGSVVHIQRARNVTISREGVLSASGLGCLEGLGVGNVTSGGAGGGGGHGGTGGSGILDQVISEGGASYGNTELPCELGSGGGNPGGGNSTAGGGLIVLGSMYHPVTVLDVFGVLAADGESSARVDLGSATGGPGGGSGGSLLLFLQAMTLGNGSLLSTAGGQGGPVGGGGGAGGRVHFHWSDISTGEDYIPIATVEGHIDISGGAGSNYGLRGDSGNISGKECPRGLYGICCVECPVGTYKNETGSSIELCRQCPPLPNRAEHTYVRGGVCRPICPYQCISEKYRMPHCYTMLEELIYTLGGPYLFVLFLSCVMVILALMLSVARMKLVGNEDFSRPTITPRIGLHVEQSLPFLESLNEVLETTRAEESQCHIHRMYFMGSNSFNEPWHLLHSPPDQIMDFVYEDAFNRFVEDLNGLAAYQWWEGSVHSILTVLAYPFAWSWQQWRRREKLQRLQDFVHSEYDHACLRSCRSRALYEGLKVAAGPDLILAYIDVFLGGDEKRPELPPKLLERLPMSIIFGGNGAYLSPYNLHSDNLLTSLVSQAVPATTWYRLVAGLNAQLRTVRKGALCTTLMPVIGWLETHANPWLFEHGVRVDLAWCQATASGYYQLGLLLNHADDIPQYFQPASMLTVPRSPGSGNIGSFGHLEEGMFRRPQSWHLSPSYSSLGSRRRIGGATLDTVSVRSLEDKHYPIFPLSFLLRNTRPVGQQASVGLAISLLILADLSLTLLMLLQFYSVGVEAVLLIVLFLPLASVLPSVAGLNALFSHGSRRSAGLARVYALWNVTSLVNVLVALVIGFLYYNMGYGLHTTSVDPEHMSSEEETWWVLPALLVVIKCVQAWIIGLHVANLEIQDRSLYANDPVKFWEP